MCTTNGNRVGTDGKAVLLCYHDSADPSCPIGVEIDNDASLLLVFGLFFLAALCGCNNAVSVLPPSRSASNTALLSADMGAGFAIGVKRSGSRPRAPGSPRAAVHIHYRHWVELVALCRDGLHFALARGRTEQAGLHTPLAAAGGGRGSVVSVSASVNSRKSGKSKVSRGKRSDAKEGKKKGRSGGGTKENSPSKKGDAHADSKTGVDGAGPGWTGNANTLNEVREGGVVHSSQARIKVVI